ncbi:hypothetical protein H9Q70_010834 [Fusarium xylarioides]|nr:hypothetical protein H9Q70_010834 [Fusarium xylarioides]
MRRRREAGGGDGEEEEEEEEEERIMTEDYLAPQALPRSPSLLEAQGKEDLQEGKQVVESRHLWRHCGGDGDAVGDDA